MQNITASAQFEDPGTGGTPEKFTEIYLADLLPDITALFKATQALPPSYTAEAFS